MKVEFVVCFSPGSPAFLPPQKTTLLISNSISYTYTLTRAQSSFVIPGYTNYIDILFFTWSAIGQQNNTIKIGVPGFFYCSGVPGCSRVFRCSWF